ncbi:MAG: Tol-Pal system protein TolB [Burkholderiales bacterium]|nr:Tol-Pal system protein TolB [Burkholderiales bacterium]
MIKTASSSTARALLQALLLFAIAIMPLTARAQLTIEIVGGGITQIPVAIVPFEGEQALPQSITEVVTEDLLRSGLFKTVPASGVTPLPAQPQDINFQEWQARGADAIVIGSVRPQGDGKFEVRFHLMDALKHSQLAAFTYTIPPTQARLTAHRIADVIYEKLTGDRGVFSTKIAYVSKQDRKYRLQVADADGYGAETVVTSNEPLISAAWSPDGTQLAYVSFERKKPIIFLQSLLTGKRSVLANFKGINSAPSWAPDGKKLAIVLTKDGNSQIYSITADGSGLQRLTISSGIDTEPSWSPDGRSIIFTSDRGGSPQIYRMPASGGSAERLTFEGNYNVSPHFSPDGRSFAFVQRNDGRFNVAVQDLNSRQSQVLTEMRLDESPSFAPNGKILLYASEVNGRGILAAVSSDGRVKQRLSIESGDVREPAWGPFLRNQ